MGVMGELQMLEKFLLAAFATFCVYLFFLQIGGELSQPTFVGNSFSKTSNLMFNIPNLLR